MTRIRALCGACRARLVTLVSLAFLAHWTLEIAAIGTLARATCN